MKLQLSQKEETEPDENTKNTEKLVNTIMDILGAKYFVLYYNRPLT